MRFARDLVRSAEWHRVRDFAQQVRASPAALAIQGEAGAGKSTLWRAGIGAAAAAGYRLLRSEPSASETDLSFAGLSDLLAEISPLTEAGIPGPQLEALQVALQLRPAGDKPPTAHAVGLAVLAALRGCLSRHPLLIAIDDVQWLDDATREVVTFALRRLSTGPLSLLVLGQVERRRKARRQSRDAFRRAYELATAMGHRPLIARVEQEMPRVAAERSGNELTATERRVADLIASGATNREAATALFVSVRTVETHVASIYRKLGVRTRAELARRLPRPQ